MRPQANLIMLRAHVYRGYLNDPEATRKAFNEEKYFLTGDLAVVHPDGTFLRHHRTSSERLTGTGSVEIQDRGKDIIIR